MCARRRRSLSSEGGGTTSSRRWIAVSMLALSLAAGEVSAEAPARRTGTQPVPECRRQPQYEAWLRVQAERWHRVLMTRAGYERPEAFTVCRVDSGHPRVDYDRDRIYLRSLNAAEDPISLAHEYLHLAFKHHPVARDERFIESTARKLVMPDSFEPSP